MEPMLGKNPKTARVPLCLATHKEHTYRERSSSHIMISLKKKKCQIYRMQPFVLKAWE